MQASRVKKVLLVVGLAAGGAMTALASQPQVAGACEKDQCSGLTCVNSSNMYSCSISPGGSCVTSECGVT